VHRTAIEVIEPVTDWRSSDRRYTTSRQQENECAYDTSWFGQTFWPYPSFWLSWDIDASSTQCLPTNTNCFSFSHRCAVPRNYIANDITLGNRAISLDFQGFIGTLEGDERNEDWSTILRTYVANDTRVDSQTYFGAVCKFPRNKWAKMWAKLESACDERVKIGRASAEMVRNAKPSDNYAVRSETYVTFVAMQRRRRRINGLIEKKRLRPSKTQLL
jgi:hypothetical protein